MALFGPEGTKSPASIASIESQLHIKTPDASVARLDLNLIRVLIAVHETRSVTAAAERLALSQPAVSYGLGKLRRTYGDRLFHRGAGGLSATPLAERIYRQYREAMTAVEQTLDDVERFDPQRSTRSFRIAMSDIGALFFLPPLHARLQEVAPRTEIEVVQVGTDDLVEDLASGRLDAAVGNLPSIRGRTQSEVLFVERYVCLMRRDHPDVGATLALDAFLRARHVMVNSPFSGHRLVDDALAERGVARDIAIRIPHFTMLPQLLAQSDLMVILPSRVAALFASQSPCRSVDLPVPVPAFEVRLHWHGHYARHATTQWLVAQLREALRGL